MNYVSACEAKKLLHINGTTLKVWKDKGIIKYKKFTNKKYIYDVDSVNIDSDESSKQRKHVIYARVSNTKQAQDLNTQIEMIKSYCISNGITIDAIYKEIASGMNENRKELNILIDEVISGNIDTVYISFKDRLTRFGFDYFKNLFAKFNTIALCNTASFGFIPQMLSFNFISLTSSPSVFNIFTLDIIF